MRRGFYISLVAILILGCSVALYGNILNHLSLTEVPQTLCETTDAPDTSLSKISDGWKNAILSSNTPEASPSPCRVLRVKSTLDLSLLSNDFIQFTNGTEAFSQGRFLLPMSRTFFIIIRNLRI